MPKIGLISATLWEIKPWLNVSSSRQVSMFEGGVRVFSGSIGEIPVVTGVCGIGRSSAHRAAEGLLAAYQPAALINAGFAAALDGRTHPGDILIESNIGGLELATLGLGSDSCRVKIAKIASSPVVLSQPSDKRLFHEKSGAPAVDMEWGSVKAACQKSGHLYAAVKVISDGLDEILPVPRGLVRHSGPLAPNTMIMEILKDPLCIPRMIRFAPRALRLSARLSSFLKDFIQLASPLIQKTAARDHRRRRIAAC